jgi:hypothetical protein
MSAYAITIPRTDSVLGSHPNVELDQAEGVVRWVYGRKRLLVAWTGWWPTRSVWLRMVFADGRWRPVDTQLELQERAGQARTKLRRAARCSLSPRRVSGDVTSRWGARLRLECDVRR